MWKVRIANLNSEAILTSLSYVCWRERKLYTRAHSPHSLWASLLSLLLRAVAFASSFFFSSCPRKRFAARTSGSGGLGTYPVRVSPYECNKDKEGEGEATQNQQQSKAKLTSWVYPSSGHILILQRSSGSEGKFDPALFVL